MSRTVGLMRRARIKAATNVEPATVPNSVGSGIELYSDAALPASQWSVTAGSFDASGDFTTTNNVIGTPAVTFYRLRIP